MGMTIAEKIIAAHLVEGEMEKGKEIAIRIDQTLTQDSTGTMAYLQFDALGVDRVKTEKSVAYIDHNMLQSGFENADDHRYIQTMATKHGIYFSRPGNGICHQVHLERFSAPGKTLLGSDSHTPTGGGIGAFAIGAGGLDVAVAMGGGSYYLPMPNMLKVHLTGALRPMVSAKDIILKVLEVLTVKGGVGYIVEYGGPGGASLSVPERATITNMGAELGATTSIFPSDEVTHAFLKAQNREADFVALEADTDATYDQIIEIDLSTLQAQIACPHSPDDVVEVSEIAGLAIDQVCIGSCTNSSFQDMMHVAQILKGHTIPEQVSLTISPGSKQVLTMLAKNGALADMIEAGARILESGCGPCIGMGQSPATDAVSLRTFNRNFKGRSGTVSADVYLVSPETAAASALYGKLTDPTSLDLTLTPVEVEHFLIDDNMIIPPKEDTADIEIIRGPNIQPVPKGKAPQQTLEDMVLLKMGDHINTDDIMPSNARLLPYRSNIPYLAEHCLVPVDPTFPQRAKEAGGGVLVAGENYGQGSSREHAALAPLYLGIRLVMAKSFARIHKANLMNNGIVPLTFIDKNNYDLCKQGSKIVIENFKEQIASQEEIAITVDGKPMKLALVCSARFREILLAGGRLNYEKQ